MDLGPSRLHPQRQMTSRDQKVSHSQAPWHQGGNVDYLAADVLQHVLARCLRQMEDRAEINGDDFIPVFLRKIRCGSSPNRSSVIYENVDGSV